MRRFWICLGLAAALVMALGVNPCLAEGKKIEKKADTYPKMILGIRSKTWEQTGKKAFIGTITEESVDEQVTWTPSNVNLTCLFNPYVGAVWEVDWFSSQMENDGYLDWMPMTLGVTLRYPIKDIVIPYVVGGLSVNFVSFNESTWWAWGYSSQYELQEHVKNKPADVDLKDWIKQGEGGYQRMMVTDSPELGYTYGAGFDVMITDNLALNFDARWNVCKIDVDYQRWFGYGKRLAKSIPFDYDLDTFSMGFGVKWYF